MTHNIIACIDDSPSAGVVCDWTAWLCNALDSDALLLHVLEKSKNADSKDFSGNLGFDSRESLLAEIVELEAKKAKIELAQGKILLEHAVERVSDGTKRNVTSLQRHDELLSAVLDQLDDNSMLVLGKQGSSGESLGSHLERITRRVSQPTLVVTGNFATPKTLMLAYDDKDIAKHALHYLAHSPLSALLDVHVVLIGDYSQEVLDAPAQAFADQHIEISRYPAPTHDKQVTDILFEHADMHDIDVLVIGAYGNSSLRRLFLGSTTLDTLTRAQQSVLLLR